jgi:DNA-directed RNA polymerase specialized sigma24 family protein
MSLKQALLVIAKSIPEAGLTFKEYGKAGRQMATTRTINVTENGPVPGKPGMVGRYQITFCLNIMDIAKEADYKARQADTAQSALANLSPEERRELLAQYADEFNPPEAA